MCRTQSKIGNFSMVSNFKNGNYCVLFVKFFLCYGFSCVVNEPTAVKIDKEK